MEQIKNGEFVAEGVLIRFVKNIRYQAS